MQSLLTHISGLIGVFVLFLQLWQLAPLDRALATAVLTTLGSFLVLHMGYVAIRWILTQTPPRSETSEAPDQEAKESDPQSQAVRHDSPTPQMTAAAS